MCGIGFSLIRRTRRPRYNFDIKESNIENSSRRQQQSIKIIEQRLENNISFRGPDDSSKKEYTYCNYNMNHHDDEGTEVKEQEQEQGGGGGGGGGERCDENDLHDDILLSLNIYASVLHMQGKEMVKQPLEYTTTLNRTINSTCATSAAASSITNDEKKIEDYNHPNLTFCWNGEAYLVESLDHSNNSNSSNNNTNTTSSSENFNNKPYYDILSKEEITGSVDPKANDLHYDQGKKNESDTKIVLDFITKNVFHHSKESENNNLSLEDLHRKLANVLSHIHGEYSFILYHRGVGRDHHHHDSNKGCIYFGRDPLGRRSLLMTKIQQHANYDDNGDGDVETNTSSFTSLYSQQRHRQQYEQQQHHHYYQQFIVSSVGLESDLKSLDKSSSDIDNATNQNMITTMDMEEIPAGRVYCLNLNNGLLSFEIIPKRRIKQNIDLKEMNLEQASEKLYQYLNQAIRRRVIDAPIPGRVTPSTNTIVAANNNDSKKMIVQRNDNSHDDEDEEEEASVAILFSGGVDSVVLAAICHDHVPTNQPIDLINVAFANKKNQNIDNNTNSKESSSSSNEAAYEASPDRQAALLSYQEMKLRWPDRKWRFIAVNISYDEVLEHEKKICGLISPLSSTMDFNIGTAFWFATRGIGIQRDFYMNGGDNLGNEIVMKDIKKSNHLRFSNDDETCKKTKSNVKMICSKRGCSKITQVGCIFGACKHCCGMYQRPISQYLGGRANLCTIHSKGEKCRKNKGAIKQKLLVDQSNDSKSEENSTSYISPASREKYIISKAKVILIGIGADEQMAGYGRHRTTYNRGGYDALRQELAMEKNRLWTRNLGRDDRCISYHGKEARFPFLDEDVVDFLNSLDVEQFCDMTRPPGEGDKLILRLIAKKIGVTQCSGLVKRAIQFGSRIAKVSDTHRFGSTNKASGTASYK